MESTSKWTWDRDGSSVHTKARGFFPEIWPSEEQDEAWFESRDAKLGTLPLLNKILEKRNERHAWFLKSFREQPLKKDGPKATSFRFLWLRTFHDAICIKVDLKNSKTSVPVIQAETLSSGKPLKTPVWKLSPGKSVSRWSPKEGPVRDLGIILLKMVAFCPSDPGEIY